MTAPVNRRPRLNSNNEDIIKPRCSGLIFLSANAPAVFVHNRNYYDATGFASVSSIIVVGMKGRADAFVTEGLFMLKRVVAIMLATVSLAAFAGCRKSEITIENEENAKEVIECSNENMFGLEKIVIFEDRAVAVFEEKICDGFEYDEKDGNDLSLKKYLDDDDPGFRLYVSNMVDIWPEKDEGRIELKNGHYIVTIIFPNKESYKQDPNEDFVIRSLYIGGINIDFDADSIQLRYVARGCDIMWFYTQEFDREKGQWTHVDEEEVTYMTEEMY